MNKLLPSLENVENREKKIAIHSQEVSLIFNKDIF